MTARERRNLRVGLLFVSPWLAGFLALSVYPFVCSLYFSFCDFSVLSRPVFIGAANYHDLLADALFWRAITNTLVFAALAVPLGLVVSVALAILLNFDVPGRGLFRTIYYLPSLVPAVCLGVLWAWLLNGRLGLINQALRPPLDWLNALLGWRLAPPNWLADPAYAKLGLVLASLWGVGNAVVICLAGLQEAPRQLYEAAAIDGAGCWRRTLHVTLPCLSPVIYFNGVMALIGSLQIFALPFVLTGGGDGPGRSLLFIATYIYQNAFEYWDMGYASALAIVLFFLILALTLLARLVGERRVYYAGQ